MPRVLIRRAQVSDRRELTAVRALLWPDTSFEEHLRDLDTIVNTGRSETLPIVILVSLDENGGLTGFLEVGLRSHADGCDPERPLGFVEG